jgi:hypothetical protein
MVLFLLARPKAPIALLTPAPVGPINAMLVVHVLVAILLYDVCPCTTAPLRVRAIARLMVSIGAAWTFRIAASCQYARFSHTVRLYYFHYQVYHVDPSDFVDVAAYIF